MSLLEKLVAIDNRTIDYLTAITWWVEVRCGKDNVDLAIYCDEIADVVFLAGVINCAWFGFWIDNIWLVVFGVSFSFLAVINILSNLVLGYTSLRQRLLKKNPQGFPNPSRNNRNDRIKRFSFLIGSILFWNRGQILVEIDGILIVSYASLSLFCSLLVVFAFLLACDSLPPEEKARRRAKNEMKNLVMQSTSL